MRRALEARQGEAWRGRRRGGREWRRAREVTRAEEREKQDDGETPREALERTGLTLDEAESGERLVEEDEKSLLARVNPFNLGVKSRALFDEVWDRFVSLSSVTRRGAPPPELESFDDEEELARGTSVLVVGGTGRVGRVFLRKLLLRGYRARVLARDLDKSKRAELPASAQLLQGNVSDYSSVKKAMASCDKVVMCAKPKTNVTVELSNVDVEGVQNVIRAFHDLRNERAQREKAQQARAKRAITKFKSSSDLESWSVRKAGHKTRSRFSGVTAELQEFSLQLTERGARFSGYVLTRGGEALITTAMHVPIFMRGSEGIMMKVCGDGKRYTALLWAQADDSDRELCYQATFGTRRGFRVVRLPFNAFQPVEPGQPPLDLGRVTHLGIMFEARRQRENKDPTEVYSTTNDFNLEVHFIKLLPRGQEPDIIYLSCAGSALAEDERERVSRTKQEGESRIRNSGLGYTVVRPGVLLEEPGGSNALLFDQGNRIDQGISCADVADICLRSLHDSAAVNKSFDVCYERPADESNGQYELVASVPDRKSNYLSSALAPLEKNT
jgi:hypothetical protein